MTMPNQITSDLLSAAKEVLKAVPPEDASNATYKLRDTVLSFESNQNFEELLEQLLGMARQDGFECNAQTLVGKFICVVDYAPKSPSLQKFLNENYFTHL